MLRQGVLALILLLLAAAGSYTLWKTPAKTAERPSRPPAIVNAVQPRQDRVVDVLEAVGTTRARQSVSIVSEVDGRILDLPVAEGQQVEAGMLLLRLDERQARAGLAVVLAQQQDARAKLQRARQLRSSNSISPAELDELTTTLAVADAQVQAARSALENLQISAPFRGVLGLFNAEAGSYVKAGEVITTLDGSGTMELVFSVPERWIGRLSRGQRLDALNDAWPEQVFTGKLQQFDSRVDPVTRSLQVRALLDNPAARLRPGQFMQVKLHLAERQGWLIPEQAVLMQGNERYVFVVEDGVALRKSLQLGIRQPGHIEVLGGLPPDARVIVNGNARLKAGDPVQVQDDPAALLGEPVLSPAPEPH